MSSKAPTQGPSTTGSPGKVYLVGAGPGDPALITLRGAEVLAQADVVLFDALAHPALLHHAPNAQHVFVGKRGGAPSVRQETILQRLVQEATEGRVVARLKGGDPYLFGRGSEEAEHLARHEIPFEVVPGVPSPLAATAYAGISLSHRHLASSIAYVTASESPTKDESSHDWEKLATGTETLVLFMARRRLSEMMDRLMAHGRPPDTPAAAIESASLPRQRTLRGTVSTIAAQVQDAAFGTPTLIVVGNVVALRDKLRWYDTQPLFGKRVLVTRPPEQSHAFAKLLREAGAEPVLAPTVAIEPPIDPSAVHDAIEQLGHYDWVLFTSQNGVHRFFQALEDAKVDARRFGNARIGCIGPATERVLATYGLRSDVVPKVFRGEALAEAVQVMHGGSMDGSAVLIPRAERAREVLPEMLRSAGATVQVVPTYRTVRLQPPIRQLLEAGAVDIITFTASSTVASFCDAVGPDAAELTKGTTVASIGPVTSETAKQAGLDVTVSSDEYTLPGLIDAMKTHFGRSVAKQEPS